MRSLQTSALCACALVATASAARADPCKAIPDHGPAPAFLRPGATFSGRVVHIIDGDSLCVAVGPGANAWVEVRLVDFYAAELHAPGGEQAKDELQRIALGKTATCKAGPQSYDRVVSACRIDGRPLGDLMRSAGVPEGGRAYHPARSGPASAPARPPSASPRRGLLSVSSTPFRSCAAARTAGAAPLYRGDPGYSPNLDRDNDGIACEPYRGR